MTAYTDRSRAIRYQECPRARYLGYEWGGRGLTTERLPVDLHTGICVHEGVTQLLASLRDGCDPNVDYAVKMALKRFDRDAELLHVFGKDISPEYRRAEQEALVEALVRVWALRGMLALDAEYQVMEVEREEQMSLGNAPHTAWLYDPRYVSKSDIQQVAKEVPVFIAVQNPRKFLNAIRHVAYDAPLVFMARADALLRQRATGDLYVYSLKTIKDWGPNTDAEARTDMQGISELAAIEARTGERLMGVKMEWLVKGKCNKASDYRVDSPLVRPWRQVGQFETEWAWSGQVPCLEPERCKYHKGRSSDKPYHNLGAGWERVNVWEHMSVADWIARLASGAVQAAAGDPLAAVVVTPLPYFRQEQEVAAWKRQITTQESRIPDAAQRANKALAAGDREALDAALDADFPQYRHSCHWLRDKPTQCPFIRICHESPTALMEPFEEGYVRRVPHHVPEMEVLCKSV